MDEHNIVIVLTPSQASAIEGFIPRFADIIEGDALVHHGPMDATEHLAHDALSWIFFCIQAELKNICPNEIRREVKSYEDSYKRKLNQQAENN